MRGILLFFALGIMSCGESSGNIVIGDAVKTTSRCMATSDELSYDDMQAASDKRDESALKLMMEKGALIILNKEQPGKVEWVDKEKTQISILGGSKWWVGTRFLRHQ